MSEKTFAGQHYACLSLVEYVRETSSRAEVEVGNVLVFRIALWGRLTQLVSRKPHHSSMYNALIRTHHITSRKKVAALKAAAKELQCYALLRSGGVPGAMYVQGGNLASVEDWVAIVRNLRYKDYRLVAPASPGLEGFAISKYGFLEEVSTVKAMAAEMESHGLSVWWKTAMGFTGPE